MFEGGFSNNSSIMIMADKNTKSMREKLQETKDLNYLSKVDTMLSVFEKESELSVSQGRDVVYFTVVVQEHNKSFMSKDVLEEFEKRMAREGFTCKYKLIDDDKYLFEVKLNLKR